MKANFQQALNEELKKIRLLDDPKHKVKVKDAKQKETKIILAKSDRISMRPFKMTRKD